jgi:hypothetical protein
MRTRVTKKAWSGPKGLVGWGWNIVSWEGGLVTLLFLGLMVAYAVILQGGSRIRPSDATIGTQFGKETGDAFDALDNGSACERV